MRCPTCRSGARAEQFRAAGEEGTRRTYRCQAPNCGHEFKTLEVVVEAANGRDAAKRQAAAIRGEIFTPTKNLHTLRLETQAESPEFKWGILATYPCTAPNLANTLGLRISVAAKRLVYLHSLGILSRREIRVGHTKAKAFEYEFLPSHKRKDAQEQEEAA